MSPKPLSSLCEVLPGFQLRKGFNDAEPSGEPVNIIQIKDTDGRRFNSHALETAQVKNPSRYYVQQGDVLLLTRGHNFNATVIDVPVQNTIAVYFFSILRIKRLDFISPAFLAWTLNHPATQEALRAKATSVHMPFISPKEVRAFEITVPPLESQGTIVALDDLKRREAELTQRLVEKRAQLVDELTLRIATGHSL